ncbi:MAG: indole-3-glycerol phosphate synthase TrpC [Candidatus Omnitrophota bacterium]
MKKTDILKEIVSKKKQRIELAKQALPEEELKAKIQGLPETRPFMEAINKPRQISLIAEIKKASPSKGVIRENFNLQEIAAIYKETGVQAVSVLTEEDYFLGNLSYINQVKSIIDVPVLRKDFILEPYQIYESRLYGADAVLLIADLLSKDKLVELLEISESLGIDCLVETHSEKELKKVLKLKTPIIGINNRDLRTLEVDLKTTEKLFTLIPKDKVIVVESGLKEYKDILFLKILGVHAVLIGEAFMSVENIGRKIEEIMGW